MNNKAQVFVKGLKPTGSTIFEHACRLAIEQGHADIISGEQIVSDLEEREISEAQIMETQEDLRRLDYIEIHSDIFGPPHVYNFKITNSGFEQFAHVGIPDYGKICANVAQRLRRKVLQDGGQASKHSVAGELKQPPFVIEHIFEALASDGLIRYTTSIVGDLLMDVCWVSPELGRKLEGSV
jgi:hypothetical protein